MSLNKNANDDPRAAVFDMMQSARAGMLRVRSSPAAFQPMTHFADEETGVIWFISATDTDFVRSLSAGHEADYVLISRDHDLHASLRGVLVQVHDKAKLDALWSPLIGAWFNEGRDDPRVDLLRFDPAVAEIWQSTTSTLKFGFEVIRANLQSGHEPDVGSHAVVRFETAA